MMIRSRDGSSVAHRKTPFLDTGGTARRGGRRFAGTIRYNIDPGLQGVELLQERETGPAQSMLICQASPNLATISAMDVSRQHAGHGEHDMQLLVWG